MWIDSLCIIQQDADDWARESTKMCDVYENAHVTIAASSALNSTQGLFIQETWDLLSLRIRSSGPQHVEIFGRRAAPDHPRTQTMPGEEGNEDWPLFERGWVLQERLMSPRVVHFLRHEVAWECGQSTLCQCTAVKPTRKSEYRQILMQSAPSALAQEWRRLVQVYSCLKLSFGSDKLPALSGLAKQMAKRRPGARYLAGLWSDSLGADLLWTRWSGLGFLAGTDVAPTTGRAPLWSWVAIDSRVNFPSDNAVRLRWVHSQIVNVTTVLETVDPTGRVSGGILTISGQLFDVALCHRPASAGLLAQDLSVGMAEFGLTIIGTGRTVWEVSENNTWDEDTLVFDHLMDPFGHGRTFIQPVDNIKLLRMARIRDWSDGYQIPRGYGNLAQVEKTEYALILQQCNPSTKKYRGVGMVLQKRIRRMKAAEYTDGDVGLWQKHPNLLESPGVRDTVMII